MHYSVVKNIIIIELNNNTTYLFQKASIIENKMSQLNTSITNNNNECKEPSDIENVTAYKERATIATAVPTNSIVYIDGRPYQEIQPSQPQVFVISRDVDYINNNNNRQNYDNNDPRLPCTIMGFCFSWIPLIGFITYLCNLDAPSDSVRAKYARGACMVAVFVIMFNLFFWTLYRVS